MNFILMHKEISMTKPQRREIVFHTRTNPPSIIYDIAKSTPDIWMTNKDDWRFREVLPDSIELTREQFLEKVGRAMGFASMCWSEVPSGIFDSSLAQKHLIELADELFGAREGE